MAKPTFGTELFEDGSAYISFDDAMDMLENFELTPEAKRGAIGKARKAHQADKAKAIEESYERGVDDTIAKYLKGDYTAGTEAAANQARIDELKMCLSSVPMPTLSYEQVQNRIAELSPQPTPEDK